jgi:proteasome lid subunit RPN8/RPN11
MTVASDGLALPASVAAALFAEAEACWPRECCGVVIGLAAVPQSLRFVRFDNQADALHAADPVGFPRDARTAYVLDALRLQRLIDAAEADGEGLVAICHSHPECPSYFSETDQRSASAWGSPSWPDAVQVVVAVFDGAVAECRGFKWDGTGWPEVPLTGLPELPGAPPGAQRLDV